MASDPNMSGDWLMEGADVLDHATAGGPASAKLHQRVSSNMYAWCFIVAALGVLWALGRHFRSITLR